MSTNVYQVDYINANLLFTDGGHGLDTRQRASEITLVGDNLNRALSNMTTPMGMWDTHASELTSATSEASRSNGSWWTPNGNTYSDAHRPQGAYFERVTTFVDEITHYGYVATIVGGMGSASYSFNPISESTVDIEASYGHGVASWPITNSQAVAQFRNASSLPSDGASRVNTTGTVYSRSNRLHPSYFTAHILNGGTVTSGGITFLVEQRASSYLTNGTNTFPLLGGSYSVNTMFPQVADAQYHLMLSRFWGYPASITYNGAVVSSSDAELNAAYPALRANDPRIRHLASFQLSTEYYGIVQGSWLSVYSNKASFFPCYLIDLATVWTSSAHPRIAGVASDSSSLDMWVLSEGGELVHLDMSVEGGQTTSKASGATALTGATERFGAMVKSGTTLYALVGTYSEDIRVATATQAVGIISYDTASNTWGTRHDFSLPARHNARSLRELITLADGKLAALVEHVGSSVVVPPTLKAYENNNNYGSYLNSEYRIPAAQQTVVVKLDARDFIYPTTSRFRLSYQFYRAHAIAATVKRVPKGSPVGTAWTDTLAVTCAGQTSWDNDSDSYERMTDWINMAFDPAYDYYVFFYAGIPNSTGTCYDSTTGPCYAIEYDTLSEANNPNSLTAFMTGDQRGLTTVPDLTTGYLSGAFHGVIAKVINTSGTDVFPNVVNTGTASTRCAWQVLIHDYTGNTWNTVALTATGALSSGLSPIMGDLLSPAAGKLLVQGSAGKDKLFLFNHAGTLDNAAFTDVSYGATASILDSAAWAGNAAILTMIKNTVDSSVLFKLNSVINDQNYSTGIHMLGWAWPSFVWDGSEKIQSITANVYDGSSTTSIAKDKTFAANTGKGLHSDKELVLSFSDTQATIIHPGCYDLYNDTYIQTTNAKGGVYYLPRYYKYSGGSWVIAKNWADAAASPMTVPSTPDTALDGPWGLKFLFGPNTTTTFLAGEYHTFNLVHGKVKFARRARYTFTVFAGRTFQMAETRTLAALRAVVPVVHYPSVDAVAATFTGPTSITSSGGTASWPITDGGALNNAPLVAEYSFTLVKPGASIIPAMTAATTGEWTLAGITEYTPAWNACARTCVSPQATGNTLYWTCNSVASPWIRAYCSTAKTVLAYSFQLFSGGGIPTSWTLQGATAVDGPWTDLHVVTGHTWGGAVSGTAGCLPPFMANLTTTGGYNYYRLIFTGFTGSPRVVNLELYESALSTSVNFTDIVMLNGACGLDYGLKFEVDLGSGYNAIAPRFRSHLGEIYVFDRQEGVQKLRITSKYGRYLNATTRCFSIPVLWDYGTTTVINAARLGSSAASENTAARGSFDTQCIGVNTDAIAVSVDITNSQQFSALWSSETAKAMRGWHVSGPWSASATNRFCVHPYFGFIWFAPNVVGTNVQIAYAWGRRV